MGRATIVKPTWSSSSAGGINQDAPEENGFLDVNISLRPSQTRNQDGSARKKLLFAPHETILSTLGEEGSEKTTFVEVHCETIGFSDNDGPITRDIGFVGPFPVTKELTRVLFCGEHEHFPGWIDDYKLEKASHVGDYHHVLPEKCMNIIVRGGGDDEMEMEESTGTSGDADDAGGVTEIQGGGGARVESAMKNGNGSAHVGKNQRKKRIKYEAANKSNGNEGVVAKSTEKLVSRKIDRAAIAAAVSGSGKKKEGALTIIDKIIPARKTTASPKKKTSAAVDIMASAKTAASPKKKSSAVADTTLAKKTTVDEGSKVARETAVKDKKAASSKESEKEVLDAAKSPSKKKLASSKNAPTKDNIAEGEVNKNESKRSNENPKSPPKIKRASPKKTAAKNNDSPNVIEKITLEQPSTNEEGVNKNKGKKPSIPKPEKVNKIESKKPSIPKPTNKKSKQNKQDGKKGPTYATGETDKLIPAEPVKDLPTGWTKRKIPRIKNISQSDNRYYSPKMDYMFRSKPDIKRFLEKMKEAEGDEMAAMLLFKQKGKGKKTITTVAVGKKSKSSGDISDAGVENSEESTNNVASKAKGKRKRETSATKQALQELLSEKEEHVSKSPPVTEDEAPKKKSKLAKEKIVNANKADDGAKNTKKGKSGGGEAKEVAEQNIVEKKSSENKTKSPAKKRKAAPTTRTKSIKEIDPNKPKQPPNAFINFCHVVRPKFSEENPDLTPGQVRSKISDTYRSLGEDELQPYKDEAARALKKYKADMIAYEEKLA